MALHFKISTKDTLVGKTNISDQLGEWPTVEMTPLSLAKWAFLEHKGYCHSIFDNEAFALDPGDYKTARANAFFIQSEVVTIDIDAKDFFSEPHKDRAAEYVAASQLDVLLANEFIRRHAFLIVPSSGQLLPDKPNWHLSFALSEPITSPDVYRLKALQLASYIGVPTDHQTCKAAQLTAGTLFKNPIRHAKGYKRTDVYINDDAERVDVDSLKIVANAPIEIAQKYADLSGKRATEYADGEVANIRVVNHFKRTDSEREAVVIECLRAVLPSVDASTDFELWNKIWMSAHHGSPTIPVRDEILNSPYPVWSDGQRGRNKFAKDWEQHVSGGITVASLFYLAMKAGWLDRTHYEIDADVAERIDVAHISEWLEGQVEVPRRVVLESQTGSGKTETLIKLYERLGRPKTVVFVPTIKLATELAGKLTKAGLPTTLYIDTKTGNKLSHEEFINAEVLVTTLQSFTMIAFNQGLGMDEYGLVYIEESDQLISQFARGGGSGLFIPSHVTERQSSRGFEVLEDALRRSGCVWMVDATMTRVTWELASLFSSTPPRYILNERVRTKAPVYMLETEGEAFGVVQAALERGEKVVAACDTRTAAHDLLSVMTTLGLVDKKRVIVLTKDTEHLASTRRFMEDVEAGAAYYDLVIYNSVMASGVSITQTTPDVFVQICSYLSPRSNLQMLNRYRSQKKVYCWYEASEGLYGKTAAQIIARVEHVLEMEQELVSAKFMDRDQRATVREIISAYSVGDENMQKRMPKHFYTVLLQRDGRRVTDIDSEPTDARLDAALEREKKLGADRHNYIFAHWQDSAQVDADHQPPEDATELEIGAGKLKARIAALTKGTLPTMGLGDQELMDQFFALNDDIPVADRTFNRFVAEICDDFWSKEYDLARVVKQMATYRRAELLFMQRSRARTTADGAVIELRATLLTKALLPELERPLTEAGFASAAVDFVGVINQHKNWYEHTFENGNHSLNEIERKYDTTTERAYYMAKALLGRLGLKLAKPRKHEKKNEWSREYRVENLQFAQKFLDWCYPKSPVSLTSSWRSDSIDSEHGMNDEAMHRYVKKDKAEQDRIDAIVDAESAYSRWRDIVDAGEWT